MERCPERQIGSLKPKATTVLLDADVETFRVEELIPIQWVEILDLIFTLREVEAIGAAPADQRVVSFTTIEDVVALASAQPVLSWAASKGIVILFAPQVVMSDASETAVVAAAAAQCVIS